MAKQNEVLWLVELRNRIADMSDENGSGWPELEHVLDVAELIIASRIMSTAIQAEHFNEEGCSTSEIDPSL